jgi:hypothetical protein
MDDALAQLLAEEASGGRDAGADGSATGTDGDDDAAPGDQRPV